MKLITNSKSFNVREDITLGKSRFYAKIMVLVRRLLLHVKLRADAMDLQQLLMYLPYIQKTCLT